MMLLCNHQSQLYRWGCVSFYYLPTLYCAPPLFLFPVFLTCPPLVVPVHSIRLDYGCVVVDTYMWSVTQCCRVMISCSSWYHQARSIDWISGGKRWKGWPRFPKSKKNNHWFSFHALLIPEKTLLELSRSGIFDRIWTKRTVLYVFSLISRHTYKCWNGVCVVLIQWLSAYTHFLPTVVHFLSRTQLIHWK